MTDPNHDIVPTLRMFDGVMTGLAADEIERLRKRVAELEADAEAEAREPHSDDVAVDSFATAMKHKLALARAKGRGGWETCSPADLSRMLREHVEKGDPRDVANFCMMLWHHGSPIVSAPADAGEVREPAAWVTPDGNRAITQRQKQAMLRDGGASASSVRSYSIRCYADSGRVDSGKTPTHQCMTCGAVGVPDEVIGCTACGFDDMQPLPMDDAAPTVAGEARLTDEQIETLAHRRAYRYRHGPDSIEFIFNRHCLLNFARALLQGANHE
ncbi:hypothetical protein [Burkholderia multivorans]|uniref:hypothetical protein n=1 Tax=Burkholderia multivorans TaxID=87883 RepID=UPI002ED1ADD9